jgi:SAM-dependent methyltransferase
MLDGLIPYEKMKHALDLGCGIGRNSIYLLSKGVDVDAIDFSDAALDEFRKTLEKLRISAGVRIIKHNLLERIPLNDATYDLIIDFYNFCQFISTEERHRYLNDVLRLLKPDGYAVFALFSLDDEYYSRFLPQSGDRAVDDPANHIISRLYSKQELLELLSMFCKPYFITFEFDDIMQGISFRRVIYILVLKGSPH